MFPSPLFFPCRSNLLDNWLFLNIAQILSFLAAASVRRLKPHRKEENLLWYLRSRRQLFGASGGTCVNGSGGHLKVTTVWWTDANLSCRWLYEKVKHHLPLRRPSDSSVSFHFACLSLLLDDGAPTRAGDLLLSSLLLIFPNRLLPSVPTD